MAPAARELICEIPYDTDLAGLRALDPDRYPALLESAADDTALGRHDILFACPDDEMVLDDGFCLTGTSARYGGHGFLDALDAAWHSERTQPAGHSGLPFRGGWFVLLGYELAAQIEPRLKLTTRAREPVAAALRIPAAVVRDRHTCRAWIVAEPGRPELPALIRADCDRLTAAAGEGHTPVRIVGSIREPAPDHFLAAVARAQTHIAAGDVYQVNLAHCWDADLLPGTGPDTVYRQLRAANPAPFAGIARIAGLDVVSSSPERLVRSDGRRIETRPIAGTRPRSGGDEARIRGELREHPKERAEHVMLIDLERNDLGRICRPGSVRVDEFMAVETYAHVHHLVSNVSGRLQDDVSPGSIIRAVFPGGSITGCPKIRCMEIIAALEDGPRGIYTGSMGYINLDGSMDINILIRTMAIRGQRVRVAAGSGIVADSDAALELEETRAKARGMLTALSGGYS